MEDSVGLQFFLELDFVHSKRCEGRAYDHFWNAFMLTWIRKKTLVLVPDKDIIVVGC